MRDRKNSLVQVCSSKIILPKLQVLVDPHPHPLIEQTLPVMLYKRMTRRGYGNAITFEYFLAGSKISLAAGLTFGSMAGYGAYCVTRDPRNCIELFFTVSAFLLTVIMGMRFKRSKKLMPAGLVACLSLLMILRLVFMLL
uniref:Transmembrane protein 14A n=1 Tax=Pavo cristatus TaxID=9049 RepID=A0A8C9FWB4_PAVCR